MDVPQTVSLNLCKNLLNATELVERRKSVTLKHISVGLKETIPKKTHEEQVRLNELLNNLQEALTHERLETRAGRSVARFDEDRHIYVEQLLSKWHSFGYTKNKKHFLHYHEALYLIEMNRLELYYESVILSLEQAYILLLDTDTKCCLNLAEYFVYRHLVRFGYNCRLHETETGNKEPLPFAEYVWKCLDDMLNKREDLNSTDQIYLQINESMHICAESIQYQRSTIQDVDIKSEQLFSNQKVNYCGRKRKKYSQERYQLTDHLLLDAVVNEFEQIFDEIQTIELTPIDGNDDTNCSIHFTFDIFQNNCKKSLQTDPKFRVIVLSSDSKMPTRRQIAAKCLKQTKPIPVLIIFVNESMAMQAFHYRISM